MLTFHVWMLCQNATSSRSISAGDILTNFFVMCWSESISWNSKTSNSLNETKHNIKDFDIPLERSKRYTLVKFWRRKSGCLFQLTHRKTFHLGYKLLPTFQLKLFLKTVVFVHVKLKPTGFHLRMERRSRSAFLEPDLKTWKFCQATGNAVYCLVDLMQFLSIYERRNFRPRINSLAASIFLAKIFMAEYIFSTAGET